MKFVPTAVDGAFRVEMEPHRDERGFFGRVWCDREFADAGISVSWRQENVGFSHRAFTLRGIHFQRSPHAEAKLVRCTQGGIFDVAVDLRPASPTYRRWVGEKLDAENHRMLFVPQGCGHAYLTLEDDTEISYLTSAPYAPESAFGARWDDPEFGIEWPSQPVLISEQDAAWPGWRIDAEGGTE